MSLKRLKRFKLLKEALHVYLTARKDVAFKVKLTRMKIREFEAYLEDHQPTAVVKNLARDVKAMLTGGPHFDAEFAFMYHGALEPQFVSKYTRTYVAELAKGIASPSAFNERYAAARRHWQEL